MHSYNTNQQQKPFQKMKKNLPTDPIELFHVWLTQAKQSEINDHEAMAIATCTKDGHPSVRMVLLKQADTKGFKFHTNSESQKGNEIDENPHAALCFHWKSLRKQIRVEGLIETVSKQEADDYFNSRPRARQIGAWASAQSRPLESRESLERRIKQLEEQYPKGTAIPRPEYWKGYRVQPNKIEFWWDNPDRLHDRFIYTKNDDHWDIQRLYP